MYRTLSPAHHEEFNWGDQPYLPVEVTNVGDFDTVSGVWAFGRKRPGDRSGKADPEVQRLKEEAQRLKLMQVMLEQLIVERTLETKAVRRDLATFILKNEEVFKDSDLWQASQTAILKDKQEQIVEPE